MEKRKTIICKTIISMVILAALLPSVSSTASAAKKGRVKGYLFVGDSRFVGMNQACGISSKKHKYVVAKTSQGYSWFTRTAMPQVRAIQSSDPDVTDWTMIIGLGVNDLHNKDRYVLKFSELAQTDRLVITSVNPVQYHPTITNSQIESFNEALKNIDGTKYINTYSYLVEHGYHTVDGLHYTRDTYKKIYRKIKRSL